jgi:ketosteroid isomerase-like protein
MTTLSTNDVLDHHLNSFANYDLAGIMADYSSDAVLFTPAGPLRGLAQIKPLFQDLVSEFAKPGSSFTMHHRSVEGDHAIFCGQPRQGRIRTNSLPTHLLSGTGR